jgi:hypothetical protein
MSNISVLGEILRIQAETKEEREQPRDQDHDAQRDWQHRDRECG